MAWSRSARLLAVLALLSLVVALLPASDAAGTPLQLAADSLHATVPAEPNAPALELAAPAALPPGTAGGAAAAAAAPVTKRAVPRHRPGRRSRAYDPRRRQAPPGSPVSAHIALERLVAADAGSDPLAGNYTLVPSQQLALLNDPGAAYMTLDMRDLNLNTYPQGTTGGIVPPSPGFAPPLQNTAPSVVSRWAPATSGVAADLLGTGVDSLVYAAPTTNGSGQPCLIPALVDFNVNDQISANPGPTNGPGNTYCDTRIARGGSTDGAAYDGQATALTAGYYYSSASVPAQQVAMVWNASLGNSVSFQRGGRTFTDPTDTLCVGIYAGKPIGQQAGSICAGNVASTDTTPYSGLVYYPNWPPNVAGGVLAAASGDLDGDGTDEIIVAYLDTGDSVNLVGTSVRVSVFNVSSTGTPSLTSTLVLPAQSGQFEVYPGSLSVATGDLDGSGRDSIVVAMEQAWRDTAGDFSTQAVVYTLSGVNGTLTVGNNGAPLVVQTNNLGSTPAGLSPPPAPSSAYSFWPSGQVAAVVAPFLVQTDTTQEQIAVVWQQASWASGTQSATAYLSLLTVGTQPGLIVSTAVAQASTGLSLTSAPPNAILYLSAGALSDLTVTPVPELVVALTVPGGTSQLNAFTFPSTTSGVTVSQVASSAQSISSATTVYGGAGVIVGDYAGLGAHAQLLSSHQLPQLGQVETIIQAPPTHMDVFPEIGAPNAVTVTVNAPDASCLNSYSVSACTSIGYVTANGTQTSQSVGFQRTWGISTTTALSAGGQAAGFSASLNASLTLAYGNDFSNTTEAITTTNTTSGVVAQSDDQLIYSATDFNLWEYAVTSAGQVKSYLAVVWPVTSCDAAGVCAATSSQVSAPGSQTPWYYPAAEPLNVLSYPPTQPADYSASTSIISPSAQPTFVVGGTDEYSFNLSNNSIVSSNTQQNFNLEAAVTANVGYSSPGQDVTGVGFNVGLEWGVQGDYSQTNLSGQSVSTSSSTNLLINFNGLSQATPVAPGATLYGVQSQWSYTLTPYYYQSTSTFNRVASQVSALNGPQWAAIYNQPDFAFIAPYKYAVGTPTQWETTDILFSQVPTPTVSIPITVTARVRNFSATPFPVQGAASPPPLQVSFYTLPYTSTVNTNPSQQPGSTLIGTQTIPAIGAQGNAFAQVVYTPQQAGCFQVWAVLDPNNQITEVHKANNQGWASLSVFSSNSNGGDDPCTGGSSAATSAPARRAPEQPRAPRQQKGQLHRYVVPGAGPPDLALNPSDITVTPDPTSGGRRLHLQAAVYATGAHYSNVSVTFYDGDPARAGRYIGHEVIPLIWAGHKSTAAVDWNTASLSGTRTLYAVAHFDPRFETRRENNAATVLVSLQPTPVVPELPTLWLFASGLLALGAMGIGARRRRR